MEEEIKLKIKALMRLKYGKPAKIKKLRIEDAPFHIIDVLKEDAMERVGVPKPILDRYSSPSATIREASTWVIKSDWIKLDEKQKEEYLIGIVKEEEEEK